MICFVTESGLPANNMPLAIACSAVKLDKAAMLPATDEAVPLVGVTALLR